MNQQISNLLTWQRTRGLRFPTYSRETPAAQPQNQFNLLASEGDALLIWKDAGTAALAPVAQTKTRTPLLFFSGSTDQVPDETRGLWDELLKKITAAMGIRPGHALHLAAANPNEQARKAVELGLRSLQPQLVVILGRDALDFFQGHYPNGEKPLERGEFFPLGTNPTQTALFTWHPAEMIRDPNIKRDVWADMQKVMRRLQ